MDSQKVAVARLKELRQKVPMWKYLGIVRGEAMPAAEVYYELRNFDDDLPRDAEYALMTTMPERQRAVVAAGMAGDDAIIFNAEIYKGCQRALLFAPPGAHYAGPPLGGFHH